MKPPKTTDENDEPDLTPFERDEDNEDICGVCNGDGLGLNANEVCKKCKGSGSIARS
jgi:E3 ubiquitin-protein ligase DOA10